MNVQTFFGKNYRVATLSTWYRPILTGINQFRTNGRTYPEYRKNSHIIKTPRIFCCFTNNFPRNVPGYKLQEGSSLVVLHCQRQIY